MNFEINLNFELQLNQELAEKAEFEKQLLELKLKQQKRESEEDSKWLANEEKQLLASVKRISLCDSEQNNNNELRGSPIELREPVVVYSESCFDYNFLFFASITSLLTLFYCIDSQGVPLNHSKPIANGTNTSSTLSTLSSVSILSSASTASTPVEPSPTAELDRRDDPVYHCTMNVVTAVRYLLQGVQEARVDQYLELVKVFNYS